MRIKSIYYRIAKDRKIKITLLAAVVLVLAGFFWAWLTVGNLMSVQARAEFLRLHPAVTRALPVYWQVRKLADITYLPYAFYKDEIPSYELEIADEEVSKMNDSLPKSFMGVIYTDKTFVPAVFRAGDKIYDVRVRYRGDNGVHWNAPKKSYLVKFKGKESFDGMTEISFVIPDDRYFALEHLNNYRAGKLGLSHPVSGFANLSINGKSGLYFTFEGWTREMLAKWGVPEDSYFYGDDDLKATGGDLWADTSGWQTHIVKDIPENYVPLERLLRLLNDAPDEEFYSQIFDMVDKDNFYAWQIHQELANSTHQHTGNVRLYFDRQKGRFFFVPWDVEIEDPSAYDNFESYGPLAARVFSNAVFLREKRELLYRYVSDPKNLEDDLAFYDRTYESFKISLYRDRVKIYSNHFADKVYKQRRQMIVDVFNILEARIRPDTL